MPASQSIREQLLSSFRAELSEHVQAMNDGLLALERNKLTSKEREESLHEVFRRAHSLKGAARTVGATSIEQLAHDLESVLDGLRKKAIEENSALFNACYRALDAITVMHKVYEAGETTPPTEVLKALIALEAFQPGKQADQTDNLIPDSPTAQDNLSNNKANPVDPSSNRVVEETATIRVDVSKLDSLMMYLSELLVIKTRAEERLASTQELQELMTLWQREELSVHSAYSRAIHQDLSGVLRHLGPVEKGNGNNNDARIMGKDILRLLDYLETSQKRLSEATTHIDGILREYDSDTTHLSQVIDQLGEEIKRVNMLPLNTITASFGRMVRDLAQKAGKQVDLQIIGGETEIDKHVLEQIKDPLIHLLRNAIDHGIELPDQRAAVGKPREGTITLNTEKSGNDVIIRVADDGAGLDLEGIRQAIRRQNRAAPEPVNEAELEEAIFKIGVSTNPIITDISGRGVGLDVVRNSVESLHGHVDVKWATGKGSSFSMTLPLRLTSERGLFVQISNQTFAIPIGVIDRILTIDPKEIISLEGRNAIRYIDRPIALVSLGAILGLEDSSQASRTSLPTIILNIAGHCMAFVVDAILGDQEVVVKGLGKQLVRVNCISGCTIMGSGDIVLNLNTIDLVRQAAKDGQRTVTNFQTIDTASEHETRRRILVVDDSITTRTLEKNILESAGYIVELAINGQEALDMVKAHGNPDLMVVDIIMPIMNGFELTQKVKNDPKLSEIPVILVTSLDSAEDKARGIEVGAEAYIVKSKFNQNNLLEIIEQLA